LMHSTLQLAAVTREIQEDVLNEFFFAFVSHIKSVTKFWI
jgi:hypothetical protein